MKPVYISVDTIVEDEWYSNYPPGQVGVSPNIIRVIVNNYYIIERNLGNETAENTR